jgi:hypothetical protein
MKNFRVYSSLSILSVVPVMEMELAYNVVQADKGETRKTYRISQGNFLESTLRFYIKSLNVTLNLSVWSY